MRNSSRMTLLCGSVAVSAGIGLIVACQQNEAVPERAADAPPPVRHAIHKDQLASIMRTMGQEARKTWPQEIQEEKQRTAARDESRRFAEAARISHALAQAADQIPPAVADVDFSPEERRAFMAGVDRLAKHARELASAAEAKNSARMRSELARVRSTCNYCHDQFAELAGPIQFGW